MVDAMVRRLVSDGWRVLPKRRHVRLESPDGKLRITAPRTPSDHRAAMNWKSQLRKLGVVV